MVEQRGTGFTLGDADSGWGGGLEKALYECLLQGSRAA